LGLWLSSFYFCSIRFSSGDNRLRRRKSAD
jgi:hypothetical protein